MSDEERIEKVSHPSDVEKIEEPIETDKKNVFFWAMYDLANTIYSMIIASLIIGKYVLVIGQLEVGLQYGDINLIWGLVQMGMQLGVAICVPILGAISDKAGKRKPFVISLMGIVLLFASLIGFTRSLGLVLLFFIIANVAYQFSLVFYDAMLPYIAKKEDRETIAGFGVAWGYLGTIISLFVTIPIMIAMGSLTSRPWSDSGLQYGFAGSPLIFIVSMLLFFIFAIPFFFVREKQKKGKMPPVGKLVKSGLKSVKSTIKDVANFRPMFRFIVGYFLVSDIANVIVSYMVVIVTDGLIVTDGPGGLPESLYGNLFIIIAAISAVIFTYFVGKFGKKYGGKNTFYLIGALWATSITIGSLLILLLPKIDVGLNIPFILSLLIGIIAGPALGGTWTASRIMVMEISPEDKFGEYFGFSKLSGKVSSAVGPLIMGLVLSTSDIPVIGRKAYALAMITLGIIMVAGIIIISFVEYPDKSKLEQRLD